jgi:ATP-dependent Clp protease ATP-binding subunit ClpA
MKRVSIDITGTQVFIASVLLKTFFGGVAIGIYAIILSIAFFVLQSSGATALMVAIALLLFPLVALRSYIDKAFVEEQRTGKNTTAPEEYLSIDIVHRISHPLSVKPKDLLFAAARSPGGRFIIRELGLEATEFETIATTALNEAGEIDVGELLREARDSLTRFEKDRIDAGVILALFFEKIPSFGGVLNRRDLSQEDLHAVLTWESFHARFEAKEPFWSPESLLGSFGGVGRSWIMGYTDELDRFTTDLSEQILWKGKRFTRIHAEKRETAMRVLEKSQLHDLLLIGRVGVGKKTLIENITYQIRKEERDRFQAFTRVVELKTAELLSSTTNPDSFLLHALKKAQQSGRFVLVIPDLVLMLQAGGDKVRGILMKFVQEKNIQLVGIMSTEDYHRYVKSDPTLDHFFEKVTVDEPTDSETMSVLMEHFFTLEDRHHVHVTYKALRSILTLCKRYLGQEAFPGKAVNVLEDSVNIARKYGESFVREEHIREIISQKAQMNVQQLGTDEKASLLNLEETLAKKIVGQSQAVRALTSTLKRARLELHKGDRPLGTFLFLGPTGVGKTHTAKVLAEEYFGAVDRMIRLDMNEFSSESSVERIVGSSGDKSYLARRVQDKPFSLVLLDEIEKAHPKVLHLFLQVLDEGTLIDHQGQKIDFTNTIIVATSNAGALFIRDFFRSHSEVDRDAFKQELMDEIMGKQLFSPEFLNRFDSVLVFYPLTKEEARYVAIMLLGSIVADLQRERGIRLTIEESVIDALVEKGYSIEFGAREMRRVILEAIENYLADYMLKNTVQRGEEIVIRRENLGF